MTDNSSSHNSKKYDLEVQKTIPYYECFHTETISLVKSMFKKPKKWLDTGCGTGNLVEKAIKEFPEFRFYLTDPSNEMLNVCKTKLDTQQIEIAGNYNSVNLNMDYKVDIITAIQSHHYMLQNDREKATLNCFNLLNEGGLYVTFENIKPESSFGIENGLKRWGDYQIHCGKTMDEVEKHRKRFDVNYFPIRITEHLDLMRKTGFKVVELFWMTNMQAGFYGVK